MLEPQCTTLCCVVIELQAQDAYSMGHFAGADNYRRKAKRTAWIAITAGMIATVIVIVIIVLYLVRPGGTITF